MTNNVHLLHPPGRAFVVVLCDRVAHIRLLLGVVVVALSMLRNLPRILPIHGNIGQSLLYPSLLFNRRTLLIGSQLRLQVFLQA